MVNENSWTKEREISLRNQGSSYFINFTAAWCITCQVNERVALTERTLKEFDKRNIKYFKADWTNRSDEIFQELKKYRRSGVPVYVFWNKNLEQPIILNEVLTEKYVMEVTK
jgi:thiol:disulfide interchange protein DsbD